MQELQVSKTTICIGEAAAMELWLQLERPFIIADKALVAHCPHQFLSRTALLLASVDGKSTTIAERLAKWLTDKGFRDGDTLVALGGHNICEIVGSAANIIKNLQWHIIPTTLLSMLNSVEFAQVRRRVQPSTIALDPDFLKGLPRENYSAGLVEILKIGLLEGDILYDTLLRYPELICEGEPGIMADVLTMACDTKADIISAGAPNRPTALNAGCILAKAIAQDSAGQVPQGQALAIGIAMEAKAGKRLGLIDVEIVEEIESLLSVYGFKTDYSFQGAPSGLIEAETLLIPFIREAGNAFINEMGKASFVSAVM